MPRFSDTIAALATPVGTSAIAVVRVSGPDTQRLVREIFGKEPLPARQMRRADYRDRGGALVDDVLFVFFQHPQSFTGEDSLEISCHGSPFIAQKILEDLFARECRAAEPGEFSQRAFLNGRMDLSQAEAVMDLIHARSDRALAAANHQLRGALGQRTAAAVDGILAVLARVEAYIDFPDEDLPAEDRDVVLREIDRLDSDTAKLLATSHYGEMLRDGIKTVILGEPNVGKSSLLNRLVGRERALVSDRPGTTRDFIEERIMVGAHWLRLIDTAGLNAAPEAVERLGIEKTVERAREADLCLVVLDASQNLLALPADVDRLTRDVPGVTIFNKSDLPSSPVLPVFGERPSLRVSALTGAGIEELRTLLAHMAESFRRECGEEEIAINARHAGALTAAQEGFRRARELLVSGGPVELVASELRTALAGYEQIAGRTDNERMLDHLFASFCIGK